jgi:quercetin dioxygenase-like cupin family protein
MTFKIVAALLAMSTAAFAQTPPPPAPPLMMKDIIGMPGKEVRISTVTSAPGAASLPHRHHAQMFVYVLSGTMQMQVKGQPPVIVGPGQTFYESPDDVHVASKNMSQTEPAKFLVMMVIDKGAPTTVPEK